MASSGLRNAPAATGAGATVATGPEGVKGAAWHANTWAPDKILFLAMLYETERREDTPQRPVVQAWLDCVSALPFATSGAPPRFTPARSPAELFPGGRVPLFFGLYGSGENLQVERTQWVECALLARYLSARLLQGVPLRLEQEGALLGSQPGEAVRNLKHHVLAMKDTTLGTDRGPAIVEALDKLLSTPGLHEGMYDEEISDDLAIALAGDTRGRGTTELPPLIVDWRAELERARKGDDAVKSQVVVAIRTTVLFTKLVFLCALLRGSSYFHLFSKARSWFFSFFGWSEVNVSEAVRLARASFFSSQVFATQYAEQLQKLNGMRAAYDARTPASSIAQLEFTLHQEFSGGICAAIQRDARLLCKPQQYQLFAEKVQPCLKDDKTPLPSDRRAMLQLLRLLDPITKARSELAAEPVVPIIGQQNAGKSALVTGLYPEAARAAGVIVGTADHTRHLTIIPTAEAVLVDCPAMDDALGAYRGLTLEMCAVARVAIFVIDVEQANSDTARGLLEPILATAQNLQRVLVCCNKMDALWRKIETDEASKLLAGSATDVRFSGLDEHSTEDLAYSLAASVAIGKTLTKLREAMNMVHTTAKVQPSTSRLQVDVVGAILGSTRARGQKPEQEIITELEAAAALPTAAPFTCRADGPSALPRPDPQFRVWRVPRVHSWLREGVGASLITMEELTIETRLGSGAFGVVFRGKWHGQDVAVKILPQPVKETDADGIADLQHEVSCHATLSHPNVVQIFAVSHGCVPAKIAIELATHAKAPSPPDAATIAEFKRGKFVGVAMKLADGALADRLTKRPVASPRQQVQWLFQAMAGIAYIHSRGYAHGDLKPANVLLSGGEALLSDFGLAMQASVDPTRSSVRRAGPGDGGTPLYKAPEQLRDVDTLGTSRATDIYAFAILASEVLNNGAPPMPVPLPGTHAKHPLQIILEGGRPSLPTTTPAALKTLIEQCWSEDREARPMAADALAQLQDILDSIP